MKLIGNWSDPKTYDSKDELLVLQTAIEQKNCTCQFCGTETVLTAQTPLGFFDVCVRDRSLPDEPINWIVLCNICSDFNSLNKLDGKGSFIEAPWIKQGALTNLLRLSYAISLKPEGNWGSLKMASQDFLAKIDTYPAMWEEINWQGSVTALRAALSRSIHPMPTDAYINQLRFRFDPEHYQDAIRYWGGYLETKVAHFEGLLEK